MIDNSTQNNKLDGFIKESLKEAEVPFNPSHWDEMEQKLNALPQASSIKKWPFSVNITIGAIVLIGLGAALYKAIPFSINNTPEEITPPVSILPDENTQQQFISAEQPATTQQNNTPANEHLQELVTKEKEDVPEDTKTEKIRETNKKDKQYTAAAEPDSKQDTVSGGFNKIFDSLSQNRTKVPTFGDMIDPVKGFVNETNEVDEVQKAVQKKIESGETDKVLTDIKKDSTKRDKVFKNKKINKTVSPDSTKPE